MYDKHHVIVFTTKHHFKKRLKEDNYFRTAVVLNFQSSALLSVGMAFGCGCNAPCLLSLSNLFRNRFLLPLRTA